MSASEQSFSSTVMEAKAKEPIKFMTHRELTAVYISVHVVTWKIGCEL